MRGAPVQVSIPGTKATKSCMHKGYVSGNVKMENFGIPSGVQRTLETCEISSGEILDMVDETWDEHSSDVLTFESTELSNEGIQRLMQRIASERFGAGSLPKKSQKRVSAIHLRNCTFSDRHATVSFLSFMHMLGPELEELFLSGTRMNEFEFGESSLLLIHGLPYVKSLQRLGINRSILRGKSIGRAFSNIFEYCTKLASLRINSCFIDGRMFRLFVQGLGKLQNLQHLDLEGMDLQDSELRKLVESIIASNARCTLQTLDVSKTDISVKSFESLAYLLNHSESLEELDCVECHGLFEEDDPAAFHAFAVALESNTKIREIRLEKCYIPHHISTELQRVKNKSKNIQVLNMTATSDPCVTWDCGAQCICDVVLPILRCY